jgi:hypothetical protein
VVEHKRQMVEDKAGRLIKMRKLFGVVSFYDS